MSWAGLIWQNLLRRPSRTAFTAVGVGLGRRAHRRAARDHERRAPHGGRPHARRPLRLRRVPVRRVRLHALVPARVARGRVAREPGVAAVAKVKLLVDGDRLVFGLDPGEFAAQRFVVVDGARGEAMAGDHSEHRVGQSRAGRRRGAFTIAGIYHSGDRFEDLGIVLPLHTVERLAGRPGEITSIGVTVKLGPERVGGRAPARAAPSPGSPRSPSRGRRSRSTRRAA